MKKKNIFYNYNKLFIIIITLLVIICYKSSAQPKALLINKEKNWGDVHYQVDLTTTIFIKNIGTDTLKILDIKPGCGCTTIPGYSNNIKPGDTAKITVDLNIKTFNGEITKSVSILTNDTENQKLVYLLKCNVIRPFVIIPRYISFDKLYVGELGHTTTIIKNTSKVDAKIKSIEKTQDNIIINLKEGDIIKSDESFNLETSITPENKGHIQAKIKIYLEHPDEEFIELSAYGRVIERKNK